MLTRKWNFLNYVGGNAVTVNSPPPQKKGLRRRLGHAVGFAQHPVHGNTDVVQQTLPPRECHFWWPKKICIYDVEFDPPPKGLFFFLGGGGYIKCCFRRVWRSILSKICIFKNFLKIIPYICIYLRILIFGPNLKKQKKTIGTTRHGKRNAHKTHKVYRYREQASFLTTSKQSTHSINK